MNHRKSMSEDFINAQHIVRDIDFAPAVFNEALKYIEDKLLSIGGHELSNYGLPETDRTYTNRDILRETSYNIQEMNNIVRLSEPKLTPEQSGVYFDILAAVYKKPHGISNFYLLFL
eukprot:GHVR01054561.1.p1 GENE.GHVR01054561.1~~GHVR01054561.1.p1  ORF type:complete len:117 (-),score=7.76 GHVR01054561.1:280-630(-)